MNRYLPIAALVASLAPAVGIPATISVSEVTEIANDGRCSLLEALDNAEQDRGIHADCPAGSGADQLVLTPGHRYTLTEPWPGSDSGTPSLTGDLEVQGNEAVIERSMAANPFRLFEILGATVTIEGLTLRQGLTQDLMIGGGALRVVDADLTLREVVLTDNRSIGTFVFGGAIRMEGGTVLIEDSQIVDNTASGTNPEHGGGAIAQFNGELTIRRSALLDNWADVPCNPASPDTVATTGGALRIEASAAHSRRRDRRHGGRRYPGRVCSGHAFDGRLQPGGELRNAVRARRRNPRAGGQRRPGPGRVRQHHPAR